MKLTIVPPLERAQALTPIILRSKIAALVKTNCGVFNGITYVAPNRLEEHCENVEYGRSYGTPCEIAAFCDMFLCEILLFRSGSSYQLLFPSRFKTCKVRGTLYFRRRFCTEQPSESIQAFHHVRSADGIIEQDFYSKLRILDSNTVVMVGPDCEMQNHLSYKCRPQPIDVQADDSAAISLPRPGSATATTVPLDAPDTNDLEQDEDSADHVPIDTSTANLALAARIARCQTALTLSSDKMKDFIREDNKLCQPTHKLANVQKQNVEACKAHLSITIVRCQKQLLHKYKLRMTAFDKVKVIVRIVSILYSSQYARKLHADMQLVASKAALQNHGVPGEGVGSNHAFWMFVHQMFNSSSLHNSPLPRDHVPAHCTIDGPSGAVVLPPPASYAAGLLHGLGLMPALIPDNYADDFFSIEKLQDIWADSIKMYHEFYLYWEKSGNHGSRPMYHFVVPGTTCLHTDISCDHCFSATKRWDSIAIWLFVTDHSEFLSTFNSEITGGTGGIASATLPPTAAASLTPASSRSTAKGPPSRSVASEATLQTLVTTLSKSMEENDLDKFTRITSSLAVLKAFNDPSDSDVIAGLELQRQELRVRLCATPVAAVSASL